jgi:outer membrane receptor protein involved in Fe transport
VKRTTSGVAVAALILAGSLCASAQEAQQAQPAPAAKPADTEEIVVTGSRIKRADLKANSPVAIIGADEITLTATVNAEDVIRELPQAIPGISPGVNNGNPGAATINLRGLDDERTLVLLDGKRFVGYDSEGIVDINNIPTSLIERIDIVSGGASAVYGSDAIAGVVNFILKRNFEGIQFDYDYINALRGGESTNSFSATVGVNAPDERGNVTLFAGWTDRDAVSQGNRWFSERSITTATGGFGGSSTDTNGNIICGGCSYSGGGGPTFGPQGFVGFSSANGDLIPRGARRFNFNPFNLLQVPQTRYQGMAMGHYDITEWLTAYANVMFAQTQVDTVIAPSGTFFSEFDIPFDSLFLTLQARDVLFGRPTGAGAYPLSFDSNGDGSVGPGDVARYPIGRRTTEVGPRITRNRTQAWQIVGGLRGDIAFLEGWSYDFSVQHGRTELSRVFENDLSGPRVQDILTASSPFFNSNVVGLTPAQAGDGTRICHAGAAAGCVVGSIFGDGSLNPNAAGFIALSINEEVYTTQDIVHADVTGDLGETVKIPGASPIALSAGFEWRRVESDSFPDDCYSTPDCSLGFGSTTSVRNEFNVKEVFGEINIPLVEDRTGIDNLAVNAGFRWADYSHSGTAVAWKTEGEYNPIEDFKLRVSYQRAVRAPNIFEFGQPITPGLDNSNGDPCAAFNEGTGATTVNTFTRNLCVQTGVPAGQFVETAPGSGVWTTSVPDVIAGQINAFGGGNPNLREEKARTLSVGGVYEPSFLEGLTIQVDWFRVKIKDAISNIDADNILTFCYDPTLNPTGDPNAFTCQFMQRNTLTGGLVGNPNFGLIETEQNIASIVVQGVDMQVNYALDLGNFGNVDIDFYGTRVIKSNDTPFVGASANVCKGKYGPICDSPIPSLKFVQRTNWTIGDFNVGYRWRYLRGTSFEDPASAIPAFQSISDVHYMDFVVGWSPTAIDLLDGFTFQLGLENAFDEDPPIVGSEGGTTTQNSGNTFPGTFDTVGRSLTLRASKKF